SASSPIARPLLRAIGELAEAIGKLDAAGVKLEAFRNTAVVRRRARQRGLAARILVQNGRLAVSEPRLDARDEHFAENVGPAVVFAHVKARPPRQSGEMIAIALSFFRERGQQLDTGVIAEGFG